MKSKKVIWLFVMAALIAALTLIVDSRRRLNDKIILGGAENAFITVDELKGPLDDYDEPEDIYAALQFPEIDTEQWEYMLANADNSIGRYEPEELTTLDKFGVSIDSRIYDAVKALLKAAENAGYSIYISAGYRSYTDQTALFNEMAAGISEKDGCSYDDAVAIAKRTLAYPGTDEHQTGLCIDISDIQRESYVYEEMDQAVFSWLDNHCAEYGFIKRYPEAKADVTGWSVPQHYRYVGEEAARFISENGLCLEEFIAHYAKAG